MLRKVIGHLRDFTANDDPLAAIAGKVALVVASNLPFYPLYLYWIVGKSGWPAWFALASVPGFLAVPWVARRHSLAGRALLPLVGILNTLLCVRVLGADTGVGLFLLPCVLLSAVLFRPNERWLALTLLALTFASYFLSGQLGAALQVYGAENLRAMIALNALSVASLTALIGLLCAPSAEAPMRR